MYLFYDKTSVLVSEIRSVISAPLMSEQGFFGLIYLDNRFSDDFFIEKDRDYLIKCTRRLSKIIAQFLPAYGYAPEKHEQGCAVTVHGE